MHRTREFFGSFRYVPPWVFFHSNAEICQQTDFPSVFSDDEIANTPLKWLKRLLLTKVGLMRLDDLEHEINRFKMEQLEVAVEECLSLARTSETLSQEFMIVVKAIPKDEAGMIPNFRIYSVEDVDKVFTEFGELYKESDREIWFCQTIVSSSARNLGGRITFPRTFHPQYIEMVWYTSPRRIEEVLSPNFPFPFWRGKKPIGRLQYQTEIMYIPDKYRQPIPQPEKKFLNDAKHTAKQIMEKREAIDWLVAILYDAGAKEVSLEFITSEEKVLFVDWDSDVEFNYSRQKFWQPQTNP